MGCDNCSKNEEVLNTRYAVESSRLMADMVGKYEKQNKWLWITVFSLVLCLVLSAGCIFWAVFNAQNLANNAMLNALENIAEIGVTEETVTTTVMQDTSDGNGNNVYQSGENAEYVESGDGE